jgi:predicted dehydrogenase
VSPDQTLRVGLVGFGRLAQNYYVPALQSSPWPLRLAIADPGTNSLKAAQRLLPGATRYSDHRELLARETLDALLVASPPSTHLAVWRAAAAMKIPVFMEKPFPLVHELDDIDPVDPAWSRLMIDFNRRFWPPYQRIAGLVRAKQVGPVVSARLRLLVDPWPWSTVSDHRSQPGEGGALHDHGSQILDLAAMIVGETPQHLRAAQTATASGPRYQIELDFPSGAVAQCEFGYARRSEESTRVNGEQGVLTLDNPNFAMHHLRGTSPFARLGRRSVDVATLGYRGLFRSRSMLRYSVRVALMSFLQAATGAAHFSPGFEDALRVARWLRVVERAFGVPEGLSLVETEASAA